MNAIDRGDTPYHRVLARIVALGISNREACRRCDLDESTIAGAKKRRSFDLPSLRKFSAGLDVPLSELLGEAAPAATPALPAVAAVAPVIAAADGAVRSIPCDSVQPWAGNPRKLFDDAAIAELAESIFDKGVLQNLVVRAHPDRSGLFLIVAGERRWRAAQRLRAEGRWPADATLKALAAAKKVATATAKAPPKKKAVAKTKAAPKAKPKTKKRGGSARAEGKTKKAA